MRPEPKEIIADTTPANSASPTSLTKLLYRNEKEAVKPWVNLLGLALISLQFFVVLRVMDRFKLENEAFRMCIFLAFFGFIVHHLLPMKARLPFFLLLSLGVTGYVLGLERGGFNVITSAERMGMLLGLGAICIGICHLRLHFYARVGMLVAVGTVLWLMRASILPMGPLAPLWPVFGAMFMFRLMVYLYDLQHEKQRPSLAMIGSYFFMLPNVALTLFPVVDYKQFSKNYYAEDTFTAYQRGVHWMARGVILLVLWRLLYYHIYIGPAQLKDGTDLIRFILSNVLLYIRVPGEFHLVIGLLTLFGFNLPETNRKFLFADSFTDYWRRVNIYWKDFMMKLVFYPAIFRMKTWNQTTAMIAATTIAFIVTWALHSYQWFWLRGTFPILTQDLIFWGMLGVLVITNSVIEQRAGRQRSLGGVRKLGPKELTIQSLKVMGVFTTMTMLWSFWNVESVPQWLGMMKLADANTFLWFLAANVGVVIAKYVFEHYLTPPPPPKKKLGAAAEPKIVPIFPFKPAIMYVALPLFAVFFFTSARVVKRFGPEGEVIVNSLASTKPNATDQAQQERGYYDDLMDVSRFNAELNESLTRAPAGWKKLEDTAAERFSGDHRVNELVPLKTSVVNGEKITINKWGMRDKEVELAKAPGTYRVAMLGSSHVFGWGVNDGEMFEALLEDRLNKELRGKPWDNYEILNFGVNGYSPVCQVTTLEKNVAQFKPDAVWFVAHLNDPFWVMSRYAKAIRRKVPPPYPVLQQIQKETELDENTPDMWAQRKLMPRWPEMMKFAYSEIVARSKAMGAQPVWIFMPGIVARNASVEDGPILHQLAKDAGFVIVDLPYSMYKGEPTDKLEIAPWDQHPNAHGHQLITDGMWDALMAEKSLTLFSRTGGTETSTRAH